MMMQAEMFEGPAAPVRRVCRGPCGLPLPLEEFALYGEGRWRRTWCEPCRKADQTARRELLKEHGLRECVGGCGKRPLEDFRSYELANGTTRHAERCLACEKARDEDVGEECLREYVRDFRRGVRWAVALQKVLNAARLDHTTFRGLRGDARRELEDAWTATMRAMARAAGEWAPEWDDPTHRHAQREGMQAKALERMAERARVA